jgi:hypothetical protein
MKHGIGAAYLVLWFVLEKPGIAGFDAIVIAGFDPALIAHKAHGTGSQSLDPVAHAIARGKPHHQLDAIGILGLY